MSYNPFLLFFYDEKLYDETFQPNLFVYVLFDYL